ncbi:patatin-like phospholipase family protein [Phenylobacterium sp.]|jgi:predicted acylesterase/phospholipase RssA|uniref:patatin-like phospholipase family protein n=1 Tax=Phenylobacterium sp. TaxID=1871053 RepID=UPI002F951A9E
MALRAYNQADLEVHFPATRSAEDKTRFEIALACTGGTSTGAYIAGVLDFILEALECWGEARDAGQAPDHDVRLTTLVGTSAGGLGVSLAALMSVRRFPHVYDPQIWAQIGDGRPQEKDRNPLWRAWVKEISLDKLLAHPDDAEAGEPSLFYAAPRDVRDTVFKLVAEAPFASGRDWLADPLDLRVVVGDLRGVPYALDFNNLAPTTNVNQRLHMHRDHVAFAVQTDVAGGRRFGKADAPDAHLLKAGEFDQGPAWALFGETAVASAAIPLVFRTVRIAQDPRAYDWRAACWDEALGRAIVDLPAWRERPTPDFSFTATDGGLFDDAPFDLARRRLAGERGRNPRAPLEACRAVVLVDPLVDETAGVPGDPGAERESDGKPVTPRTRLGRLLSALVFAPISQARLSTFDLALIKDEDSRSRFMIAPSRCSPNNPKEGWGPGLSLMTSPMKAVLGFADEAYREHDFLLGRRNAQAFLRRHFHLPKGHALFHGRTGWTAREEREDEYPIIPLRGTADVECSNDPEWSWQALDKGDIDRLTTAFGKRADGLRKNLLKTLGANWLLRTGFAAYWKLFGGRKAVEKMFRDALTTARDGLNPADRRRSDRGY